jgi:hypothetical protein
VIGIFKQKNPANILLLLVFGVLIKLPMFLHPHIVTPKLNDALLYKGIINFLAARSQSMPSLFAVFAFVLLFLQAIMLTRFINNQRMMSWPSYFPGMAYLLITSLFPEWNYFSAPLIINSILLFVLSGLFKTYNQQNAKGTIFNVGVALGIATFLFFPSLTFVIWVLFALMVMRPFRLNEWLLCIIGITTPFYFYAIYLFINGQWSWHEIWPQFTVNVPEVKQSAWMAGSAFLITIPFLAGGYYVQDNLRRMLIQVRKGWSLLLLFLLGAIFIPFVNSSDTFENWVMAAIPFAAFHACTYLYSTLRIFPLILFWATVGFILAYQYVGPGW